MATTSFVDNSTLIQASWLNDADTAAYAYLTSVAGTNTVTATGPASMTAYAAGQKFRLLPANTNTGATTINITPSGAAALGAKNIYWNSAACVGGEFRQSVPVEVMYDGTQFQIVGSSSMVQFKGATLTANRIPYAVGSSSLLQDSANLTFNGTTLTLTGSLTASANSGLASTAKLYMDGIALNGDTYIVESSANVMDIFCGGVNTFRISDVQTTMSGLVAIGTSTAGAGLGFNTGFTVDVTSYAAQEGAVFKISNAAGDVIISWNTATSGNNNFMSFYTEGGTGTSRGTIDYNRAGGAVRYNTSSNEELKNIFGDADPEISKAILRSTRVAEYEWKDNVGKRQIGVIAQEVLASGFTGAVSLDDAGTPVAVDKTAWNFHLIAGWKAHDKDIEAIKSKLGM